MNEDFGVGRRRATQPDVAPRQATIDVNKYQPAANLAPAQPSKPDITNTALWGKGPAGSPLASAGSNSKSGTGGASGSGGDSGLTGPDDSSNQPNYGDNQPRHKRLVAFFKNLSRKQWIIIIAVLVILIGGGAAYALTRPDGPAATKAAKSQPKAAEAELIVSPLTGMPVSEEDSKRPVIGVMIENSTFARPQSGLQEAGVVYEAIAEYGITRFLALYQEASPANIGPVRSARPYYVDWARGYDAAYGHVGGSPDALAKIKADGVRDLDQFANAGAYRRTNDREAPHNVYTTGQQLRDLTNSRGWTDSKFTGLTRKKESPAKQVTANSIDIAVSGPTYNVHFDYDAASNTYPRTMGGEAHSDNDSKKRITPKVVVGLVTQYGLMADGYHSTYATTGSGSAKIFQDGTVTEATWTREANGQYKFADAGGKALALNPGQVWFTVVGDGAAITSSGPAPATPAAP